MTNETKTEMAKCSEMIDGHRRDDGKWVGTGKSECGNEYDSEKYSMCYRCSVKNHAKKYGVSATKRKYF